MKTSNETQPQSMSTELRTKCEAIRRLMCQGDTRDAKRKYQIATEVLSVTQDENKYGKGSVNLVAVELGCTPALLYSYASVASTWEKDAFNEATDLRNSKGLPPTFSHFVELAKVESAGLREKLMTQALAESWSVRALALAVQENRTPDAPEKLAATPRTVIRRLVASSNAVLDKAEGELAALVDLTIGDGTEAPSREQLETSLESCRRAKEMYERMAIRIAELLTQSATANEAA